jgi:hypothetical protein
VANRHAHVTRQGSLRCLEIRIGCGPGTISAGQQAYGNAMLSYTLRSDPSVVSVRSWTLIFDPAVARGRYRFATEERFALDTRLNSPAGLGR